MATVYLAQDLTLDRKVAIKVISPDVARGAEMIARFRREAKTAAALTHPHIIPIYAVKGDAGSHLLRDEVRAGTLPRRHSARSGAAPLPHGAHHPYRYRLRPGLRPPAGVVHRDVKPGNILVEEEGFAVITDFGIAKAAESESLTRSGTTVGTPSYLSPEACAGDRVGPAADQYSLGIVGYEMITGQLPFTAESSLGMMYAQVHTPPRPSTDLRSDCPRDLHDTIMRMLEKSAEDRFANLKDATLELSLGQPPADRARAKPHRATGGASCRSVQQPKSVGLRAVRCSSGQSSRPRPSPRSGGESGPSVSESWRALSASWQSQQRSGDSNRAPEAGARGGQRNHCTGSSRYASILQHVAPRATPASEPSRPASSAAALHPGDSCKPRPSRWPRRDNAPEPPSC